VPVAATDAGRGTATTRPPVRKTRSSDLKKRAIRGLLGFLLFAAVAIALAFLIVPIVAIFTHVPPGDLIDQLSNDVVRDALIVSIKTTLVAQVFILVFGTPLAYVLATRRFPGRSILVTLVELPIVLPPAVAGIGLLVAFGRFGLLGEEIGGWLAFTWMAVVCAVILVAGPFYVRQAIAAFETVDANLVAASRTLGAGPVRTFFHVTLPLARGGLIAGQAVAMARGLGEFGATIMFAGSLQGETQTLPLAIYQTFDEINGFDTALAISALLVIISLAILLSLKISGLWQRSRPVVGATVHPDGS
jgi:molybdate transport system permease protein